MLPPNLLDPPHKNDGLPCRHLGPFTTTQLEPNQYASHFLALPPSHSSIASETVPTSHPATTSLNLPRLGATPTSHLTPHPLVKLRPVYSRPPHNHKPPEAPSLLLSLFQSQSPTPSETLRTFHLATSIARPPSTGHDTGIAPRPIIPL